MEYAYTFRMDEKTYSRLMAYCKKMKITKSTALRSAIELLPDVSENGEEEIK